MSSVLVCRFRLLPSFALFIFLLQPGYSEVKDKEYARSLIDSPGKTIGSDFNGDGIHDLIVGAYYNDDGPGLNAGVAYIFFGASNLSGTKSLGEGQSADVTILGKADSDLLDRAVPGAGDVNDDGFDDVIVGAYGNDDAGLNAGAAYIFFGASNLSGTKSLGGGQSADVTILGKAAGDNLGRAVSGLGDVNSNGFPDVIVGAHLNDDGPGASIAGAAYVFFGASNLGGTKTAGTDQNVEILGKAASDRLGRAVGGGRSNPGP